VKANSNFPTPFSKDPMGRCNKARIPFRPSTLISVSAFIDSPPKRGQKITDLPLKWQIHNIILTILRFTGLCYQLQVLDALSNRNAQRVGVNDPAE